MLKEIAADLVHAVRENVESGIKTISDKFSPRIESLEKSIEDFSKKELDLSKVETIIEEKIKSIPAPKDGIDGKDADPVDMEAIKLMVSDAVKEAVSQIDLPEAKDGEDGKDALQIDIEPSIDESKSYHRGTYAIHDGGLWRSYRRTNGMGGWEVIVEGIKSIEVDFDGHRDFSLNIQKSSGDVVKKDFNVPAMIYKDMWKEGEYKAQDCVTLSGSLWVALKDTSIRPGESSDDWRMVAKKGGTGKSAYDIWREAGNTGDRSAFLASMGIKTVVKI